MPYIAGTPEAIQARLGRKDSKNFATTCRGVNPATGAQCRRGLSKNVNAPTSGIVTFVNGEEAFFCWQHKEQAKDIVLRHTASWKLRRDQQGRTSLDTLIETVEFKVGSSNASRRNGRTPVVAATATATAISGKKETVGLAAVGPEAAKLAPSSLLEKPSHSSYPPFPKPKEPSFFYKLFLCCFGYDSPKEKDHELFLNPTSSALAVIPEGTSADLEKQPKNARRHRPVNQHAGFGTTPMASPLPHITTSNLQHKPSATAQIHPDGKNQKKSAFPDASQSNKKVTNREAFQKQSLFSVIPRHLSAKTALLLQQELLKPFSDKDEPGYIYIFWLQDKPTSGSSAAGTKAKHGSTGPSKTNNQMSERVLFKIGRANNVQRRLHQWTEQCNYDLSLVRYYPHISTSTPQRALTQKSVNVTPLEPRKVPNVHKIERLIHLELRDDPLVIPPEFSNPCMTCGRKHKEWFSIEASRQGITAVDEIIKRWVKWGEDNVDLYTGGTFDPQTGTKTTVPNVPVLEVPSKVDHPATGSGNSPNRKGIPKVVGATGPKNRKVSGNSEGVKKGHRRQAEEDTDWDYRTESDDDEEEWVETARLDTDTGGNGKKKKMQAYRD